MIVDNVVVIGFVEIVIGDGEIIDKKRSCFEACTIWTGSLAKDDLHAGQRPHLIDAAQV